MITRDRSNIGRPDDAVCWQESAEELSKAQEMLRAGKAVLIGSRLAYHMLAVLDGDNSPKCATIGWLRRHMDVSRWAKALIEEQIIGPIARVDVRIGKAAGIDLRFGLVTPDRAPKGCLLDPGGEILDLLSCLLGPIRITRYEDDSKGGRESECKLSFGFLTDGSGAAELSRTRTLRNSVRIEGSTGFVEFHFYRGNILAGSPNALRFMPNGIDPSEFGLQLSQELTARAIQTFRRNGGENSDNGLKPLRAIRECHMLRTEMKLPWETALIATGGRTDSASLPLKDAKILVTGAGGFIGGRLVERLFECGANVRCLVRSARDLGRLARYKLDLVEGDITDKVAVKSALNAVDYVFHCAYDSVTPENNRHGLRNLLNHLSPKLRRFVQVSTFAVYEPFPDGKLTETVRDGDRNNTYVDTKLQLEQMIFAAARSGIPATVVQPAIVFGPFCWVWTNTPAEQLLSGNVVLPRDGEGVCNSVYVDDVVSGMLLAAISPNAVGERFILSGPDVVTWKEFYEAIAQVVGAARPTLLRSDVISLGSNIRRDRLRNLKASARRIMMNSTPRNLLLRAFAWTPGQLRKRAWHYLNRSQHNSLNINILTHQQLHFFEAKAVASSGKAQELLGYKPIYSFSDGMSPTGEYLKWAYAKADRSG